MELLFSGLLVALRYGRKISPGLGCMVPCLFRENRNTHFMFNNLVSFGNRANYAIMWGKCSTGRQATHDDIIRCMRFACRVTKATDTHSEYVILIAFSTATAVA